MFSCHGLAMLLSTYRKPPGEASEGNGNMAMAVQDFGMSQRQIHPTASSTANLPYTGSTSQWFWVHKAENNTLLDGEREEEARADGRSPRW